MGKYVIKRVKSGYEFCLRAMNGETIVVSDIYSTVASCRNGVESVRRAVEAAAVEDQTSGYVEKLVYPKFEVCQTDRGEYRFRLKAGNGEIVAASDIYAAKSSCLKGIASVRRNALASAVYCAE